MTNITHAYQFLEMHFMLKRILLFKEENDIGFQYTNVENGLLPVKFF